MSRCTTRPQIPASVALPTKRSAAAVMIGCTATPAFTSRRATSTAL
jgi:hypothetical protein